MILKTVFRKGRKPTCLPKAVTKKQKLYNLRYEIKIVTEISTSQEQPKRVEAFDFCPNPQQQKKMQTLQMKRSNCNKI